MSIKKQTIDKIQNIEFSNTFIINANNQTDYSYDEFFSGCFSLAEELKKKSAKNLFVVLDNSVELCSLFFSAIIAQKQIVVVDPEKGEEEISTLRAENSKAYPIIRKSQTEENTDLFEVFQSGKVLENIKEKFVSAIENYDFDSDYLITYTSGTSGNTKGVINSLSNLFGTTFSFEEKIDVKDRGTLLHLMPMTYMAGILNSIFMPFIMGCRIVIGNRFSVKTAISFWKTVEKYNVNFLWMSPMMLTMIDKVDRSDRYEKYCREHSICFLIGTAPLSMDVRERFQNRYGVLLQASYGLSETLFVSVETKESIFKKQRDNVGEILSGVDYKISEDGELLINVPWMFNGYTNENTNDYFCEKYYLTGDLAEVEDGVLSIVGRKKDLIIRGGMNISPKLIEDCISQMGCFTEFCVFGKKNKFGEEEVCCAFVLDSEDSNKNIEKEVSAYVKQKLGSNYLINSFVQMEKLPRNINGKIDKRVLRGED